MSSYELRATILIVDDERGARFGMRRALSRGPYHIAEAADGGTALELIRQNPPDLVFLDINMPGMNGLQVLEEINKCERPPLVVMVTAHGSEKIAVEAMKKGAFHYIAKPYEVDELRLTAKNALEKLHLQRENQRLLEEIRRKEGFGELIGESKEMRKLYDLIDKVSATNVTVLLQGESGTGKELVAREIHRRSARQAQPFVPMNCAALPENLIESELFGHEKGAFTGATQRRQGKMEQAHGGTLFLDEIGDMSLGTQAKVLRVLQEQNFQRLGSNELIQVDVRFISATHKDLQEEISKMNFREDLYYRIKVVDIHIPPLRERPTDIPLLSKRFLEIFAQKHGKRFHSIDPRALKLMMQYDWPGNVRELKNEIEKAVVLAQGETLTVADLPPEITRFKKKDVFVLADLERNDLSFKEAKKTFVQAFERRFIEQRLKEHQGNITKTAQSLDMPRQSLQQKLKELGIHAKEFAE